VAFKTITCRYIPALLFSVGKKLEAGLRNHLLATNCPPGLCFSVMEHQFLKEEDLDAGASFRTTVWYSTLPPPPDSTWTRGRLRAPSIGNTASASTGVEAGGPRDARKQPELFYRTSFRRPGSRTMRQTVREIAALVFARAAMGRDS